MRLEPRTPGLQVKHFTTEPPNKKVLDNYQQWQHLQADINASKNKSAKMALDGSPEFLRELLVIFMAFV